MDIDSMLKKFGVCIQQETHEPYFPDRKVLGRLLKGKHVEYFQISYTEMVYIHKLSAD